MIHNLFYGVSIIFYYLFYGVLLTLYYVCYYLVVLCVILLILLCLCGYISITPKLHIGSRSRRCGKSGCRGFKNGNGCSYKSQTEECLKLGGKVVEEVDQLPLKESSEEDELDIESLMSYLKELAPTNGRALLLFRDKCGCLVAKLEAWGTQERFISKEDEVCCICLSKYATNDELRQFPCSHFFHKRCIDRWLKMNELCPLCKGKVDKDVLENQMKLSWKEPKTAYWTRIARYVPWGQE